MYYVRHGLVKYVPPGQSNLYKIAIFSPHSFFKCKIVITMYFSKFFCNRGDTIQYQGCLQSRKLGKSPYATDVPNSKAGVIISPASTDARWSDCICYRIEKLCLIGTLSTILQHCTHNENPVLLAYDTSCHLSTPSHPGVPPV